MGIFLWIPALNSLFLAGSEKEKNGILVTTSLTLPDLPAGTSQTPGLLRIVLGTKLTDKSQSQNRSQQIPAGAWDPLGSPLHPCSGVIPLGCLSQGITTCPSQKFPNPHSQTFPGSAPNFWHSRGVPAPAFPACSTAERDKIGNYPGGWGLLEPPFQTWKLLVVIQVG